MAGNIIHSQGTQIEVLPKFAPRFSLRDVALLQQGRFQSEGDAAPVPLSAVIDLDSIRGSDEYDHERDELELARERA